MADFSVIFIENGFPPALPGFLQNTAVSAFPFWGNFTFFDLLIINFFHKKISNRFIISDKNYKKTFPGILARWRNEIQNMFIINEELNDFLHHLNQIQSSHCILCLLPHIALFQPDELISRIELTKKNICRISVEQLPLNIYSIKKKLFIEYMERITKKNKKNNNIISMLFQDFLLPKLDCLVDIPGNILFSNKIIELYNKNLWFIRNLKNKNIINLFNYLSEKIENGKDSVVSEFGYIKDSYIASGVSIDGSVENSVIFPGVIINRKTKIINSVIMNNNIIGRNVVIQNSLILPTYEENNNTHNIGDNSVIGGKKSTIKNTDFPDQLTNGLTLIGLNAIIPRGFRIEESSYLGPNIPLKQLKHMKVLKKGISLYIN